MMTSPDVSVVVCTYNRAELLRGALESLGKLQTGGRLRYEIVVVDNGSTDHTDRVVEEAIQREEVPIRCIHEPRAGVACARNCAVRLAAGTWIAFFDDDQLAEPDWLLALVATAERTGARYVGGAVRLALPETVLSELPPLCRRLLGESVAVAAPCKLHRKLGVGTGNLLIHRTVFDQIGPFDESLRAAGEDTDLTRRVRAAGIEGWFNPSAVVRHVVPTYRLQDDYFRWTSVRNGTHLAHRERQRWGRIGFPPVLAARAAQVMLRYVPRWLWAHVTRSRKIRLEGRCQLWRAEGYFRLVLGWAAPSWLARSDFASQIDFRTERELFAPK
ncbi:MAG: glycosyltransferase [Pirellulales bacterium]|nr:glycosyltransferase [Pirellulales bacterium]